MKKEVRLMIKNKIDDLANIFIGTVMDINISTRMVAVFVPKLMPGIIGGKSFSSLISTTLNNPKITGLKEVNTSIRLRNSLWVKSSFYKTPMPKIGSKVAIFFIDGNLRLGHWYPFDSNNNYEIIDEEKHPPLFKFSINNKNIIINENDDVKITFPETFSLVYDEKNDKTKTYSLFQKENYIISDTLPINPSPGLLWCNPSSENVEFNVFINDSFKRLFFEEQFIDYINSFVEGDRQVDLSNGKLYTFQSGAWNQGEEIYLNEPVSYIEGDRWVDTETGILYTYTSNEWLEGDTVFLEEPNSPEEEDQWYDENTAKLYTYLGGVWDSGTVIVSIDPIFYNEYNKWYDVPNRYLYTYGTLGWDKGYYVPVKKILGGN